MKQHRLYKFYMLSFHLCLWWRGLFDVITDQFSKFRSIHIAMHPHVMLWSHKSNVEEIVRKVTFQAISLRLFWAWGRSEKMFIFADLVAAEGRTGRWRRRPRKGLNNDLYPLSGSILWLFQMESLHGCRCLRANDRYLPETFMAWN